MPGQLRITGGTLQIPSGIIVNEDISSSTDIDADKLEHLYCAGTNFGFVIGGTPTTREELVHIATTAGVIRGFHCLLTADGSATSIVFDLKKNGTTCLSSAVTLTHSSGDGVVTDGTLSVTTFAADDRISISMTVGSSSGAQGPYAWAELQETSA